VELVATRAPKVSDVFLIPTGDNRAGIGQVIGTYGETAYYIAILRLVLTLDEAGERATEALASGLLLLGLSLDAKFHAGHWAVVGHSSGDPGCLCLRTGRQSHHTTTWTLSITVAVAGVGLLAQRQTCCPTARSLSPYGSNGR
jgi:hypothetical protein